MTRDTHFDDLLSDWPFDSQNLSVRMVKGTDDRDVIQLRVDMGILQLETTGRPDGSEPQGYESYLDVLRDQSDEDPDFILDEESCNEIDREFMQFYHRRICWLRLQFYRRAVNDADHTLALMDIAHEHSPEEDWTATHEQYRPFVWFHRTQAHALAELEDHDAEHAIQAIQEGLTEIQKIFSSHDAEEHYESDELVIRLRELADSLRNEYSVGRTLQEQLQDAVDAEQYELAARLRDELARRTVE